MLNSSFIAFFIVCFEKKSIKHKEKSNVILLSCKLIVLKIKNHLIFTRWLYIIDANAFI